MKITTKVRCAYCGKPIRGNQACQFHSWPSMLTLGAHVSFGWHAHCDAADGINRMVSAAIQVIQHAERALAMREARRR